MKIATYNVHQGGAKLVHWTRMIENGVDLLLLQETCPPDDHLPPLIYPNARSESVWAQVAQNRWGSAVFAPGASVKPVTVPGFAGSVVGAEVIGANWQDEDAAPLVVFSIHAPDENSNYHKPVNKVLDEIKRVAGDREIIVGGDFNLTVSHFPGAERPANTQDLAVQARLADEFGLINCWQTANPDRSPPQTLRWARERATPYHCDGIFVPKAWRNRLVSCDVLAGEEWEQLSDHNPVIATFS